jgi:hypothetical protein
MTSGHCGYGEPRVTCLTCGRAVTIRPAGKGAHVDQARTELVSLCQAAGCPCDPEYDPGNSTEDRRHRHKGKGNRHS